MLLADKLVETLKSKGDLVEALYELSGSYKYREFKPLLIYMFEEMKALKERADRPVIMNIHRHVNNFYQNSSSEDNLEKFMRHTINQIAGEIK